jgi:lipid-binding SYLF domain-containing protein
MAYRWGKRKLKKAGKNVPKQVAKPLKLPQLVGALKKESAFSSVMHQEVMGALQRMQAKDPGLAQELQRAHGYAVFPDVGKATVVLGGAYGLGEVFEHGHVIGYAGVVQLSLGVQLGGETHHELVIFDTRDALERFKHNRWAFAADASAVFVAAGAAGSSAPSGMRILVRSEGGMMLGAAIGAQKFIYKPAVLGRLKTAEPKATAQQAKDLGGSPPPLPH